jgi:hypothetical protein
MGKDPELTLGLLAVGRAGVIPEFVDHAAVPASDPIVESQSLPGDHTEA